MSGYKVWTNLRVESSEGSTPGGGGPHTSVILPPRAQPDSPREYKRKFPSGFLQGEEKSNHFETCCSSGMFCRAKCVPERNYFTTVRHIGVSSEQNQPGVRGMAKSRTLLALLLRCRGRKKKGALSTLYSYMFVETLRLNL
jgi:hypothetical protein